MTHTPGPWDATNHIGCKDVGPDDGTNSARMYAIAGTYGISPEAEDRDNAALIAAAPELRQRLKESRDAIASLPSNALGTVFPDDGPPLFIKDELLGNIDVVLAKTEAGQ